MLAALRDAGLTEGRKPESKAADLLAGGDFALTVGVSVWV